MNVLNLLVIIYDLRADVQVDNPAHATCKDACEFAIEVSRQPVVESSQSEHEREGITRWQLVAHTHVEWVVLQFNTVERKYKDKWNSNTINRNEEKRVWRRKCNALKKGMTYAKLLSSGKLNTRVRPFLRYRELLPQRNWFRTTAGVSPSHPCQSNTPLSLA